MVSLSSDPNDHPEAPSSAMPHEGADQPAPVPESAPADQQAEKEPDTDTYRFTWGHPVEYPFFSDPDTGRSLLAQPGEQRSWPDGPPDDGHWVPVEAKE